MSKFDRHIWRDGLRWHWTVDRGNAVVSGRTWTRRGAWNRSQQHLLYLYGEVLRDVHGTRP